MADSTMSQIREARLAAGLSMKDVARRAGVSQPTVANWEVREREGRITLATLARAAEALQADLTYAISPRHRTKKPVPSKPKPPPLPQRAAVTRPPAPRQTDPNDIWL